MKVIEVERKQFKCPSCRQRFKTKKNIPRHLELKHSPAKSKRLQCHHCKKLYQNKSNHKAHYKKEHLKQHLIYMEPIPVDTHLIAVRKMARKKPPIKRQKSKTNGLDNFEEKAAHNVYHNPFNKKPYAISQLNTTDAQLVARRRQMEFFECAKLQLRYF